MALAPDSEDSLALQVKREALELSHFMRRAAEREQIARLGVLAVLMLMAIAVFVMGLRERSSAYVWAGLATLASALRVTP
jgi:hypothetical protein